MAVNVVIPLLIPLEENLRNDYFFIYLPICRGSVPMWMLTAPNSSWTQRYVEEEKTKIRNGKRMKWNDNNDKEEQTAFWRRKRGREGEGRGREGGGEGGNRT
ncbi:hypothetical protein E2C01_040307 [Portunus trituberculatus]|uniref:Uncharacterized protein n=1 Tax=Portunus trituberculatus TaxID=210409 RepID=A0A5B7FMB0_PORTR|nr:hypothetical protein [Portunus trituberculatus]